VPPLRSGNAKGIGLLDRLPEQVDQRFPDARVRDAAGRKKKLQVTPKIVGGGEDDRAGGSALLETGTRLPELIGCDQEPAHRRRQRMEREGQASNRRFPRPPGTSIPGGEIRFASDSTSAIPEKLSQNDVRRSGCDRWCEARTQGFPIVGTIGNGRGRSIAPPSAAGRHNGHSVRAS
jgi:hypothetical protein